jgi:hypothetical protein
LVGSRFHGAMYQWRLSEMSIATVSAIRTRRSDQNFAGPLSLAGGFAAGRA